uniref:Probable methylthioribulose-1-phosphate dehydratase n=1 Tax=Chromera velia CCMP2878 TaxID=1169474 RepID=A0A0G4FR62_9ALVE|eukprot:Cvel_18334.t1-p1 / transcript=Cvel_18334.t1 / gene=Cvel_18334 / organism=Chromera_velia_CCMP2878 / gene_product=Probable methylthioribulose-1-phosphate dehydratase, putative / transcript_product=Probable methylthioribulose-1-phosphate dehydratase, putative / location=Cvel_scaffold1514:1205-2960(+) / protein_length=258 / sequence_SO=supercontig / SO=protein_coding / is_pseudo=false
MTTDSSLAVSPKERICELCRIFYNLGWASGTGGGISVKEGETIYMAPSGVQKERMKPEDIFVLNSDGSVREPPKSPALKLSQCAPLFMAAYEIRGAGAVMHSHSLNAVMATVIDEKATEFKVTCLEMMKGIAGHEFYDEMVVPIVENTAYECDLADSLREAITKYPKTQAVLVRRHGVYVWGKDWVQAKTQAECYDYLFEAAIKLRQMGVDPTKKPPVLGADYEVQMKKKQAAEALTNGGQANGRADNGEPSTKKVKA